MSLTCHEEIGRVGRVGRKCYEDASDLSATVVRVVLVDFGERHDTRTNGKHYIAADRRPTNQVSVWQTERGSRPTRPTSSHPRGDPVARVGRVREDSRRRYEETAPVEFKFYVR